MKNSWVICGPESSGSALIAKTVSFATGHCDFFGQWSGYKYNSESACENLVLHSSLPCDRPRKFQDWLIKEVATFSEKYERVNYILTTRDRNCSIRSKILRFGDTKKEAEKDYEIVYSFFEELVNDDNCFIWSYETMILLGKPYFSKMYRFFGIESDFVPEIYDGNAPYIRNHFSNPIKHARAMIRRQKYPIRY